LTNDQRTVIHSLVLYHVWFVVLIISHYLFTQLSYKLFCKRFFLLCQSNKHFTSTKCLYAANNQNNDDDNNDTAPGF